MHHAHAACTHDHGDEQVIMEAPHVVGLCHTGHDQDRHSDEGQEATCQHPKHADGSIACDCFDDDSSVPCSGSHGPHECCDEADCNFVADQRDNVISLLLAYDWSPLLTYTLSLSSQEVSALRTEYGSPPDPHAVHPPLRVKTQVWRL
ncbi:hypothetical protein [Gimesia maris]|uniref:hypothetical protein n=1 Tax=Gimesia maris TaxID=122 RepID=UPI003A91B42B